MRMHADWFSGPNLLLYYKPCIVGIIAHDNSAGINHVTIYVWPAATRGSLIVIVLFHASVYLTRKSTLLFCFISSSA